jgi:hypothetical protein
MEFVHACPLNTQPNNQAYEWHHPSIENIPRHRNSLLQGMRIEDIDVIYKEHAMERLDQELDLFSPLSVLFQLLSFKEYIPRNMLSSATQSPDNPVHRSSAVV